MGRKGPSKLEETFAFQIRALGLPAPEREFRFHPKRRWLFDFSWPELMLAVEVEGGTGINGRHVRPAGFREDCIKYASATLLGWRVIRGDSRMVTNGMLAAFAEQAITGVDNGTAERSLSVRRSGTHRRQTGRQKTTRRMEKENPSSGNHPPSGIAGAGGSKRRSKKKGPGTAKRGAGKSTQTPNGGNMSKTIEMEIEQLEWWVASIKADAEKFNKGNKAAGTRVRSGLLAVRNLCNETRAKVSEIKNAK